MSDDDEESARKRSDMIHYVTCMKRLSTTIQGNLVELNKAILEVELLIREEPSLTRRNSARFHELEEGDESNNSVGISTPQPNQLAKSEPSVKDLYGKNIYEGDRVICLTKGKYKCNTGEVYCVDEIKGLVLIDLDDGNKTSRKGNNVRAL